MESAEPTPPRSREAAITLTRTSFTHHAWQRNAPKYLFQPFPKTVTFTACCRSKTGELMKSRPVRMTDGEWEKCKRLGGAAWIRERITKAKEPPV